MLGSMLQNTYDLLHGKACKVWKVGRYTEQLYIILFIEVELENQARKEKNE